MEGDLYIGKEGKAEIVVPNYPHKISGSIYELDLERLYPLPEFPEHPAELTFRGAYSTRATSGTITEDGYYDTIDVYNPLTIDVGNGIRKIRVKKLAMQGWSNCKIIIVGSGKLELYVDEQITFSGSSHINYGGDIGQIMIYYSGDDSVTISGDSQLHGCYFSKSKAAGLHLTGSGGVNGVIMLNGSEVTIPGGTQAVVSVLYAPDAEVKLTGGGSLSGAIVCESFSASGGTWVAYDHRVKEIWKEVPQINFDFEIAPGGGSEPGSSSLYRRGYWSD